MPDYTSELEFAIATAIEAGEEIRGLYDAKSAQTYTKPDESPVTDADLAADRIIRTRIGETYPKDAILTEEGVDDKERLSAERVWIVDPIDGTRSFVHGVPLFGVLIALEIDATIEVGVCHLPAVGETLAAARGRGCTWNGRPARVSRTATLDGATVVFSDSRSMRRRLGSRWADLDERVHDIRGWGDCYGHCLVATGRADVMLDAVMNPWDCAALLPILEESGGRFTDWRGQALIDGGDAVSSNSPLHDAVLDLLR